MDVSDSSSRAAKWWVGGLVALSLLGVAYQGWQETQRTTIVSQPDGGAPDFALRRADGKGMVVLSQLRGKVVMLDFWATWCGPCVAEIPVLTRLAKEYESRGVVFVAANRDDPGNAEQEVRRFIGDVEPRLIDYAVYADDRTSARYDLRVLPTLVLIGRNGQVVATHLGLTSEADLRESIELALAPTSP